MRSAAPLKLWVRKSVIEAIAAEALARAPLETGGCLAGYYASGSAEVVISQAIGPGPKAHHAEARFVPDRVHHDRELEKLWKRSGRSVRYIGDWHSHPDGSSELSRVDREFMRHALGTRHSYLSYGLVALVYGRLDTMQFWCLTRGRFGLGGKFLVVDHVPY